MLFRKKRHEIISEITVTPTPIIMKTKDKIKNIKPRFFAKSGPTDDLQRKKEINVAVLLDKAQSTSQLINEKLIMIIK